MSLGSAFLGVRPELGRPDLEAALAALVARAQVADGEGFVRYLAERLPPGLTLEQLHAEDLALARGCAAQEARALQRFDELYLQKLRPLLAGARVEEAELAELSQVLRERLLLPRPEGPPRIADYRGRGPLSRWLRIAAVRLLLNLRRGAGVEVPEEAAESEQVAGADPELAIIRRRFQDDFSSAFKSSFAALEPADRNLLRLHYVDGLGLERLGPVLAVSRATAARRLAAARAALVDGTSQSLRERLKLPTQELESLIGAVRSRLHLSFSELLRSQRSS